MAAVTLALSDFSAPQIRSERTFSCSEWPQSARSLHVAWPASPATTRHQKHLWHGGYRHKRSSGLGWAGSCPSFDRSQTKLWKTTKALLTSYFLLYWICVQRFRMHHDQITLCPHLAQNSKFEFPALHYCYFSLILHIVCIWGKMWTLRWRCKILWCHLRHSRVALKMQMSTYPHKPKVESNVIQYLLSNNLYTKAGHSCFHLTFPTIVDTYFPPQTNTVYCLSECVTMLSGRNIHSHF